MTGTFNNSPKLETIDNPEGRLDVLLYKCAKALTGIAERKTGLDIWSGLQHVADEQIRLAVSGKKVNFPPELVALAKFIAANKDKVGGEV